MTVLLWLNGCMVAALIGLQLARVLWVNNWPHMGDSFTYLRVAREMKRQRSLFPRIDFSYTGENTEVLQLPPLFMAMLVPLAKRPYSVAMTVPTIIDLTTALLVGIIGHQVMELSVERSWAAALMFLLTPINATTAASLTPRSPALLWLTVFVTACSLFVAGEGYPWLLLAAGGAALAFMTQRMVTQIILILSPLIALGFTLFEWPQFGYVPVAAVAALALALTVCGGRYWAVLSDHLARILVHARVGQQQRMRLEFGSPLHIIKANPWLLVLLANLLAGGRIPHALWLSAAFVTGLLVLAVVWVMGNSVNHMYFASPFVAWLVLATLPDGWPWIATLAMVAAVCVALVAREFRVTANAHISHPWMSCFKYIGDRNLEGRALVLPSVSFPALPYYTNLVIVSGGHGSKAMTFNRMLVRRKLKEPGFINELVCSLAIRYVLVDRKEAPLELLADEGDLATGQFTKIYDNDRVIIFEAWPAPA